jgi:acetolactate synthase regulatory subunit
LRVRNKKIESFTKNIIFETADLYLKYSNMIEKYSWKIQCNHSPETIDRIIMPIRKRGLSVISMNYKRQDEKTAVCNLEFEIESSEYERIFKNMLRIYDITNIEKV